MSHTSPWHAGERELQQRVGVAERMDVFGRKVIRDYMPDQHRDFYRQLPFLVVAAVDEHDDPWVTLLVAPPGFAHSPEPRQLQIDAMPSHGDPVRGGLHAGAAIGVLGIELHTRRRNRVNGELTAVSDTGLTLGVGHSFGNCPQYIQRREFRFADDPAAPYRGVVETMTALDEEARQLIAQSDTFFIGSYVDTAAAEASSATVRQVDASHRGGKPGFVRIDGNVLTIPDFAGNLHFNTLGNLRLNPRAGLVFVDFQTGDMLQLTGRTELIFEGPEVTTFQGAERLWRVDVQRVVRRRAALTLRWSLQDFSPNSLMTGSWEDAQARQQAHALRHAWRPFRVAKIVDESASIKSFYLEPQDNAGLAVFAAGQHLPVRIALTPDSTPVIRTYTLSAAPSDGLYRISVKKDGAFSRYLHEQIRIGDVIEARAPQGEFTVVADERRPLVMLAGGIGITPLLAMLRHIVYEGLRIRRVRKTYFFYAARHLADRAFNDELLSLIQQANGAIEAVRVISAPEPDATLEVDYEVQGRIDITLLKAALPFDDYDFYVCGPGSFTQSLYDGLREMQIPDKRIHAEQFGPSTLKRTLDVTTQPSTPQPAAADKPTPVLFANSAKEARWQPDGGTLLDLAESRGLTPELSCRGGSCGTCKTRIVSGQVHHTVTPGIRLAPDEALICCAVPAASEPGATTPLVLEL